MDGELEKYHKQNGALELVVGELKLKIDGLQKEVAGARQALADARALVQRFHHDLSEVAHHIQVRGEKGNVFCILMLSWGKRSGVSM